MPTEAKQATVAELKEELSNGEGDDRGRLPRPDRLRDQAVRRNLRGQGITYRVVKNRLAKIAAEEAGDHELDELLDGPTALAMGSGDEVLSPRRSSTRSGRSARSSFAAPCSRQAQSTATR